MLSQQAVEANQEFEVLRFLTQIAEVLNTDTVQFEDCCIKFAGGDDNANHSS